MHQAIPPAPSPHGNCGGGALASFCAYRGSGIYQPRGHLRALDTHVVSYSTITTKRILLEKQADWPICQGREKIEEGCKGMFSILCMHFFTAYQARITYRNLELSRRESTFFG